MHTLSDFRDASPAQKADMMLDGLSYLQSMVNQTTQHLRIYNRCCQHIPGLVYEGASKKINADSYTTYSQVLHSAIDKMGEQITQLIELQKVIEKTCLTNPSQNEKS